MKLLDQPKQTGRLNQSWQFQIVGDLSQTLGYLRIQGANQPFIESPTIPTQIERVNDYQIESADLGLHQIATFNYNQDALLGIIAHLEKRRVEAHQNQKVEDILGETKLLAFEGDPEDESFVSCSGSVVNRVRRILYSFGGWILRPPFVPRVSAVPNGSIDVHWKTNKRELLLNVPASQNAPASLFGDDYGNLFTEGRYPDADIPKIIGDWLRM